MRVKVDGKEVYLSTGGRTHVKGRPFLMFLHGAGFNHYSWTLQGRSLAYDGYNVIAADMPGHGFSEGDAIEGIENQADWALSLMDALGADEAVLAGHSMGGLIMLEMAKKAPQRVKGLVFIATAAAIPVNQQLIEQAETDPEGAYQNMVDWAYGGPAHMHDNTWPGASHLNYGVEVMRMCDPKALAVDLRSCAGYSDGAARAAELDAPVMVILSKQDKMTPVKFGQKLASMIKGAEIHVIETGGHSLPVECPREVNALLRTFLGKLDLAEAA